jgi:viroplasmin and RNaseH domain-containing protein
MANVTEYATNWENIDLKSSYQRSLNILDPYSFETLLLEIHCNLSTEKLTKEAVLSHAKDILKAKYTEALQILEDNAEAVLNYELAQRED